MKSREAQLVALAVLYLGEGAKWKGRRGPMLGSSDPDIIRLYIKLLKNCYGISVDDLKCRVQHRADQDSKELIRYWVSVTGVDKQNFYLPYVDKRTIGHKTVKQDYHGVCAITCAGTHVQLELEQIAGIIVEAV